MNSTNASNMNSTSVSQRMREKLLNMCGVAVLTILCFTPNLKANVIDDLFQWAAQQQPGQQPGSKKMIKFAMASNEVTRNNLVGYSVGWLTYYPPHVSGRLFVPATFASAPNDNVTQYFSDRFFAQPPGGFAANPFDPTNTDPLRVTIGRALFSPNYSINLQSPKWGFNYSFTPSYDVSTNIITGTWGNVFLTVSLGDNRLVAAP
jgi:hypothetical protein